MNTLTKEPNNILVLEVGGIGDAVIATPALNALRRRFPNARITVVASPRAVEIIWALDLGFRTRTLRLALPLTRLLDAARLILSTRSNRPDLLIDLSAIETPAAARRRQRLVALLGARYTLGRNTDGRGDFFDAAVDESLADETHEVERKLSVVATLGARPEPAHPIVDVPRAAFESEHLLLEEAGVADFEEVIGIHPGAFLPTRQWPVDRFARLADLLTREHHRDLLVTGGEADRDLVEQVAAAAHHQVVRAVGRPLMEAAALIRRCRAFVTNDTGMMHVAAALNVPVVALFGRTNAARYRPYMPASRCVLLQQPDSACQDFTPTPDEPECRRPTCHSRTCMTGIQFDTVHQAVQQLLERTRGAK